MGHSVECFDRRLHVWCIDFINVFHFQRLDAPCLMHCALDDSWPATTQPGQWQEFGATQWLFEFMSSHSEGHSVNAAWLTSLMDAGCVAACRSTSQLLLLLAVSQYTYAAWTLEIFRQEETGMVLIPCKAFSLTFGHVLNLEDWVTIPVKPALRGTLMVLVQTGQPLSLAEAKLQAGAQLTVQQCKDLLQALGVSWKGAKTRADYLDLLVDNLFTSEVSFFSNFTKGSTPSQ